MRSAARAAREMICPKRFHGLLPRFSAWSWLLSLSRIAGVGMRASAAQEQRLRARIEKPAGSAPPSPPPAHPQPPSPGSRARQKPSKAQPSKAQQSPAQPSPAQPGSQAQQSLAQPIRWSANCSRSVSFTDAGITTAPTLPCQSSGPGGSPSSTWRQARRTLRIRRVRVIDSGLLGQGTFWSYCVNWRWFISNWCWPSSTKTADDHFNYAPHLGSATV